MYWGLSALAAIDVALVVAGFPVTAILMTTAVILVWSGSHALVSILICAAFVTRFRVEVSGAHFLPEHLLVLSFLCAILLERRAATWLAAARSPVVLAVGAFIVWQGIVSVARAPDLAESLRIVAWLGLDWLLLVCVLSTVGTSARIERLGVRASIALALIAVAIWIAHILDWTNLGTQGDGAYEGGARAVFGLAFEANILASTLAVWAFIALSTSDREIRPLSRVAVPLSLVAIAVSLTRSAILAFFLGLLVWALLGGRVARRRAVEVLLAVVSVALVALVAAPSVVRPIEQRIENLLQIGSGTGGQRVAASETALHDLTGLNFVTGLGTNSYGQRHLEATLPGQRAYLSAFPLQILYDSGVVGVALLGFAFVKLRPFEHRRRGRALGATTVYLVAATATSPFWFGWTWVVVALAVMTTPGSAVSESAEESTPGKPPPVAAATNSSV